MRTYAEKTDVAENTSTTRSAPTYRDDGPRSHQRAPIISPIPADSHRGVTQLRDHQTTVAKTVADFYDSPLNYDFSQFPIHLSQPCESSCQASISANQPQHSRGAGNGDSASPEPTEGRTTRPETTHSEDSETSADTSEPTDSAATPSLRWQHVKRHRWDALWFFCGEHPSGFSTTATLRAEGYTTPNNVEWFIREGADKVYAPGGFNGPEITLHSSAGSRRANDVQVEVQERSAGSTPTSYLGQLTVRKPHRLRRESTSDHPACPPGNPSPGFVSEITYRIFDNVSGTIIGATVNERFPGPVSNDQPNNWRGATVVTGSSWSNTDGTFTDNLLKCGGTPSPVAPASSQWSDKVFNEPHEFYVGSTISGRGCRVQRHTLQFYRGFADHENVRSPAP